MKKYKDLEDHVCRFNDGECVCDCFDAGYKKALEQKELKFDISNWKKIGEERGYFKYFEKEMIEKFREIMIMEEFREWEIEEILIKIKELNK